MEQADPPIKAALDYLRTGGLAEVWGLANVANMHAAPKIQMDTDLAIVLCMLANVCLKNEETPLMFDDLSNEEKLALIRTNGEYLAKAGFGSYDGEKRDIIKHANRVIEIAETLKENVRGTLT